MSVEKKINLLRKELHKHNYLYYMLDKPEISDHEFDKMLKELHELELQFQNLMILIHQPKEWGAL